MPANTQLQWYMVAQQAWVACKAAAKQGSYTYAQRMANYYMHAMQQAGLNG